MRIEVAGIPAPQGSKRHVGGGRMVEVSRAVGPWREAVRAETQRVLDREGSPAVYTPAAVEIMFRLRRPASHYGTGRNARTLKPSAPRFPIEKKRNDIDKLVRAVLDGITDGGALDDDAQVVDLYAVKAYADDRRGPGCSISIEEA